jgi:phosphopantetheinyl transferase
MPVKFVQQVREGLWLGVWEITEQENELIQLSGKQLLPDNFVLMKSEIQRKQSLCGRLLVRQLSYLAYKSFNGITKNENGKPFLKAKSGFISISHTKHFAAATLSTKGSTGIDLEAITPRILKVIPRVSSPEELLKIKDSKDATLYWCAKEALYKLYDKPGLDFSEQLQVQKTTNNKYAGFIYDNNLKLAIDLEVLELDNFMLVYAFS